MSGMQRNFSFQAHDDDPSYSRLPLEQSPSPPRPPRHQAYQDSLPPAPPSHRVSAHPMAHPGSSFANIKNTRATDGRRVGEPASPTYHRPDNQATEWNYYGHPQPEPQHRAPSGYTTVSSVSSLDPRDRVTAGMAPGGEYARPRDADSAQSDPYATTRQSSSRKPIPAVVAPAVIGGNGYAAESNPGYGRQNNGFAPSQNAVGDNVVPATPKGGYRSDERFWGKEIGYSESVSSRGAPTPVRSAYGAAGVGALAGPPYSSYSEQASNLPLMGPSYNTLQDSPMPPPHRARAAASHDNRSPDRVLVDPVGGHYTDNPYKRYSTTWDPVVSGAQVDGAADIMSDDDDDLYRGRRGVGVAAGGAAGAAGAASMAAMVGKPLPSHSAAPPVDSRGGSRGGMERGGLLGGSSGGSSEKAVQSVWLQDQARSKKKTRWIIAIVVLIIILAAAGGAAAGVILSKHKGSGSSPSSSKNSGGGMTASEDIKKNGDLTKDSPEIKALMGNKNLKKVFHGMDYTPLNAALYPECIKNPPTQNNITRDIAVMSQLTNKLRLYGTDCNQTEMVLHAIDVLGVDMKVWLGVWLDSNTTTNTRQLGHLYKLLANYKADMFAGIAVGNEVLFRQELTQAALVKTINDVRSNLTSLKINLPVGTSDLGSNWKSPMVEDPSTGKKKIDVLMANVHPFFAGVKVEDAANWTYSFFETNDVVLTKSMTDPPRVMISEVGWPSGGGSLNGSVAGVSQMNRFMKDFICTENARKTEYFWFSAFDEPWKLRFNNPSTGEEWEDKWGLMDVDRRLKDGVMIPDCT